MYKIILIIIGLILTVYCLIKSILNTIYVLKQQEIFDIDLDNNIESFFDDYNYEYEFIKEMLELPLIKNQLESISIKNPTIEKKLKAMEERYVQ